MLELDIFQVDGKRVWPIFAPHHYLTGKFNGHRAFVAATVEGDLVGFTSSIVFPHGRIKNADGSAVYRGHRTVVLPDYQGLGIGSALSEWIAEWHLSQGQRYYSKTSHPRLGMQRDRSPKWRATSSSGKQATEESVAGNTMWQVDWRRVCFSHEYVG